MSTYEDYAVAREGLEDAREAIADPAAYAPRLMNETQARTLREAHDAYVKSIHRKPAATLRALYRQELNARGTYSLYGGPVSKDELIGALVELRYPLATMNESVHVLYHVDGITNDACEHCPAEIAAATCPGGC